MDNSKSNKTPHPFFKTFTQPQHIILSFATHKEEHIELPPSKII
jgi:hypothetical protein